MSFCPCLNCVVVETASVGRGVKAAVISLIGRMRHATRASHSQLTSPCRRVTNNAHFGRRECVLVRLRAKIEVRLFVAVFREFVGTSLRIRCRRHRAWVVLLPAVHRRGGRYPIVGHVAAAIGVCRPHSSHKAAVVLWKRGRSARFLAIVIGVRRQRQISFQGNFISLLQCRSQMIAKSAFPKFNCCNVAR